MLLFGKMEEKIRHLELIQGVINRFSTNSFLIKGWSVLLVSALFALSGRDSDTSFVFISFLPGIAFWGLDGYFLSVERLYRKLYEQVRQKEADQVNFSMSINGLNEKKNSWASATFSKTLIPFHGTIAGSIFFALAVSCFT